MIEAKVDSRLISFKTASRLLGGMGVSTIRERKGGTENLTHVPGFGRRVFLIRTEVEQLVDDRIARALAAHRKNFRLVKGAR